MRVATLNLWHGLSPTNWLAFTELEPSGRRQLRQQLQVQVLQNLAADILFLQEVNPLHERASDLAKVLGFEVLSHIDLVGAKILGLGLPINLHSGLAILAKPSLALKRPKALKLSGGRSLVTPLVTVQFNEQRYALMAEAMHEIWGRVLVVNTHLHHGLEVTPQFLADLESTARTNKLSQQVVQDLKERCTVGDQRRHREVGKLLNTIEQIKHRFELILIGGDFNVSPSGAVYQMMQEAGFVDLWSGLRAPSEGLTFDPQANSANHVFQSQFAVPLFVDDLTFKTKVREALVHLIQTHEQRPRRIDYLWARVQSRRLSVEHCSLFGLPNAEGLAPSDHFGVQAGFELLSST